ncbi:GDSL-type esterase/lipase family protein [Streptomyces lancefieldiae]|uniref:GDSL-type esterase/lipase family protein n=1 Tax=Streptomyces lancefieldiae TaxID=3075520 RepID=A0ABU3AUA9_9ACTN|nr:GDSL-type esterase/lipase family protein [Streptomyces sp. DSM 40712]MDT0613774.1 GDSL-type esterase/lipase family protein [Streptomyces sp. DSM 40712]
MLRFMFVGDSMTIGSAGEHTWRYRLWEHLRASYGRPFTFVGPREALHDPVTDAPTSYAYAEPDFPRAHLAGWGEGWHHMAPLIGATVRTSGADVLLVSLGLIDLGFYTNADQTADNVRAFVAGARTANPRVRMAVMPVVPNIRVEADASFAGQVHRFNELLAKTIADLDEPGSSLLLVPPPAAYDFHTDTYDGTHPNESGEHRIAGAFADAMDEEWGLGAPYSASA